jgi:nicotinic acid mononucleotide adenylyltransferase
MENKLGIFVGRFSPTQLGHEMVAKHMIEICGIENSLLVLGSSNASMSFRHLFSYENRRSFLKKIFGDIQIIGMPDYPTDREWLMALDDILSLKKINPREATFFGGCEEDIHFFLEAQRKCEILNRFDGSTPRISATEVRDALIQGRSLEGLLNPIIMDDVQNAFAINWNQFKKM